MSLHQILTQRQILTRRNALASATVAFIAVASIGVIGNNANSTDQANLMGGGAITPTSPRSAQQTEEPAASDTTQSSTPVTDTSDAETSGPNDASSTTPTVDEPAGNEPVTNEPDDGGTVPAEDTARSSTTETATPSVENPDDTGTARDSGASSNSAGPPESSGDDAPSAAPAEPAPEPTPDPEPTPEPVPTSEPEPADSTTEELPYTNNDDVVSSPRTSEGGHDGSAREVPEDDGIVTIQPMGEPVPFQET